MNTVVTSRDAILEMSKSLIKNQGWASVNIRAVAASGHISVGSVYNYFSSKSELVSATIESVWFEIFQRREGEEAFSDFSSCIIWFFDRAKKGAEQYPDFVNLHAMSFMTADKASGRSRMEKAWAYIQQQLLAVLQNDTRVRTEAFQEQFSQEKFIQYVFYILLVSLARKDYDGASVVQMIERVIY